MLGWEQAIWTVMLWGVANVYQAYAASQLHVQPLVFTCTTFISAALVLTIIGGKGHLVRETLKSPSTWMYGVVLALIYVITIYLFQLVTATEGALMQRFSVIVALVVGIVFFKRFPKKLSYIGALAILLGVCLVGYGQESSVLVEVAVLLFIISVFQTLQIVVAELHPQTNKSRGVREECRVVGLVMFVVSTVFFVLSIFLAKFFPNVAGFVPSAVDYAHLPTIISGFVFGIVIVGPIKYLEFSSVRKIKSENFLAIAALSPLMTFAFEALVSSIPYTGMSVRNISSLDIVAAVLITAGAMYIAWQRLKPDYEAFKATKAEKDANLRAFIAHVGEGDTPNYKCEDEAIKEDLKQKRENMDKQTLRRLDQNKLSDEEKELLKQQELKDAGIVK